LLSITFIVVCYTNSLGKNDIFITCYICDWCTYHWKWKRL